MSHIAIRAQHLSRRFGKFTAVDEVSFSINYGSIFGFLGANGSGKSTTMKMLCGILAVSSGSGEVAGFDINRDAEKIKTAIGYVSQRFSLYADLTVVENLVFYGRIYGLEGKNLDQRIKDILILTGLEEHQNKTAEILSGGLRQRLAIANAILHQPKIIFLDEPTAGIDPLSRRSIWEILYQLADEGAALFVTTHYMEEAERCNTIAFISQGKILKIGTPADLKDECSDHLLEINCSPIMKASRVFKDVPGLKGITVYGTTLHLNVNDTSIAKEHIKQKAQAEDITITSIMPVTASLEDVFAVLENQQERR